MANSIYLGGGIKSAYCGGNVKEIWQGTNKLFPSEPTDDALIFVDCIHDNIGLKPNAGTNKNYLSRVRYDETSIEGKKIPYLLNTDFGKSSSWQNLWKQGVVWNSSDFITMVKSLDSFTIEYWAYVEIGSTSGTPNFGFFKSDTGGFQLVPAILKTTKGYTYYSGSGAGYWGTVKSNKTWNHYCFVFFKDSNGSVYIDGVRNGIVYSTSPELPNIASLVLFPCYNNVVLRTTGVKFYDYAKYTENFTPSPIPQINA